MGLFSKLFSSFKKTELNSEFYDDLTEILISSDMGVVFSEEIIEQLKIDIKKSKIKTSEEAISNLKEILITNIDNNSIKYEYPLVITIIGVNGVGKTTSIAKMANYFKKDGKTVMLAAADTFRAAATAQLNNWAEKLKVKIVKQGEGVDPASIVFDAIESAKSKNNDVLIIDTAGRLHTKTNLMGELEKIGKIVNNKYENAKKLNFIVLDASIGQNSLAQVKAFKDSINIDGIIVTKLDGSAKGGVIFPIINELNIPVCFIGYGENVDDFSIFDADSFVNNIL